MCILHIIVILHLLTTFGKGDIYSSMASIKEMMDAVKRESGQQRKLLEEMKEFESSEIKNIQR